METTSVSSFIIPPKIAEVDIQPIKNTEIFGKTCNLRRSKVQFLVLRHVFHVDNQRTSQFGHCFFFLWLFVDKHYLDTVIKLGAIIVRCIFAWIGCRIKERCADIPILPVKHVQQTHVYVWCFIPIEFIVAITLIPFLLPKFIGFFCPLFFFSSILLLCWCSRNANECEQ